MAHPPFFYLLLKPWVYIVGSSMSGLRVFTVALSIAAIMPLLVLCRELHLRIREIALASSLMAVNNYLILYSYYLRPYSLLLFLTLSSHVAFVRFLRHEESDKRRALLILVEVNIPFVYTHYFAWLVVAAPYLWVAFMERRRLRRFTAATPDDSVAPSASSQ
ncbi:MAG: glycosyltransferase family 39 protein [Acidobacteria bacterium]|nr:glycosyltransferase family 39 protein [Acidobacteriota bacterium]